MSSVDFSAIHEIQSKVKIGPADVKHVCLYWYFLFSCIQASSIESSNAFSSIGIDNSLDLAKFKEEFKVKIEELSDEHIVFHLSGIDAPIANAFRRILISEVCHLKQKKTCD